ncbi:HEAT repeat domain-containing protein [Peribacillus loiseleuriae]|uniref:HEAT repeat domain-containing protein n=1 Tax=Peribacillus loiseleuriae TaxID=1679170 RepID=A0A0K9GTI8_9BACI|nr:HEAT repeat domain-containing protein [Peribacillus loiseleuriae]KMY49951.1 hypothetical protein AC625_10835 [Peribacillus loiseleuriae]
MTNQAYTLLWISGGLILIFFIAILVTWSYGHFSMLIFRKINRKLEGMLSSFFHAEIEEEKQQVIRKLNQYMKHSSLRKDLLINCIIQKGEAFIEDHHKQLMNLYEATGIKTFLIKRLSSKRDYIRALACRQLGDLRLYSTESYICNLISSKNNNVTYNVLLALAKLGDLNNLAQLLTSNSNNIHFSFRAVIEVIAEFKGPKESKEALLKKTIESSDDYMKGVIIKAAADGQYEGLSDYYVKYLSSNNINLKIACIRALSELNNSDYEQFVIDMLESEEWEVRAAAAKGLGAVGTSHSFEPLGKMTSDKEWWVRHNAANALISIPGGNGYAQHILNGEDQYAREAIMAVIGMPD